MIGNKQTAAEDILIVDDNVANLQLLAQMLSEQGFAVRAVTNGTRAITSAMTTPPNLILLDIRMPGMDGYEVCRQLKADRRTKDIPVIFISALDEIQDKVTAFEVGGVDFITKPFHLEEILARTHAHLALRRLQAQLQEANDKFESELRLAGQIQASCLPARNPIREGWQFAKSLHPARETSGDFFDFIHLPHERLAVVIADVVDKGVGAALFMVLSLSLIRTYAQDFPDYPEQVLEEVNRRILMDSDAHQFVTVFYGILDPKSGKLTYCNAGQLPPLHYKKTRGEINRLIATGKPLGLFEGETWERRETFIDYGDSLVLYTDGITDVQDRMSNFFDEVRLQNVIRKYAEENAQSLHSKILETVEEFIGEGEHPDDIALITVKRNYSG